MAGRKYVRDAKGRFASKGAGATAGNVISPSPRKPTKAEAAYLEIRGGKGGKRLSDKKVREEMQRRGFLKGKDPHGELINIAHNARAKAGQNPPSTNSWISTSKPPKPKAAKARKRK